MNPDGGALAFTGPIGRCGDCAYGLGAMAHVLTLPVDLIPLLDTTLSN